MRLRVIFALACLLASSLLAAQAQTVPEPLPATPLQRQDERLRIDRARTQLQAEAERANAACYQKFAVFDCQRKIRVKNRRVLDELRRQELILNDLERHAKANKALDKINEKSLTGPQGLEPNPLVLPADR
jgi:hypothetical protein